MPKFTTLFSRPQVQQPQNNLENQVHSIKKISRLQQIFSQDDIEEALTDYQVIEKWIQNNQTEVTNALQTLEFSMHNLFVAIGFINSIEPTLRRAVIVAFLQRQDMQN